MKQYISGLMFVWCCLLLFTSCGGKSQTTDPKSDLETTAESEAQKRVAPMLDAMDKASKVQRNEADKILKNADN